MYFDIFFPPIKGQTVTILDNSPNLAAPASERYRRTSYIHINVAMRWQQRIILDE
jgi:hypothetical protein